MVTQIALVGCAHIHTPGFVKRLNERSGVRTKYVWDHEPARARKQEDALATRAIVEVGEIWADSEIEGVIICSETNRHEQLVLAGAAANKHMFVEKPLGMGADDAYRMTGAIERAGVLFQTGYFMRGNPIHLFLREQIEKGSFGKITRIRHSNCHAGSLRGIFDTEWRWMADPEQAGCGAFGDLGTHSLDVLLWLMGDVASVTADVAVATGRYGDCDEYGEGLLAAPRATPTSSMGSCTFRVSRLPEPTAKGHGPGCRRRGLTPLSYFSMPWWGKRMSSSSERERRLSAALLWRHFTRGQEHDGG
jgi:predicted dehydrogenase